MGKEKRKSKRFRVTVPVVIQLGDVVYNKKEYLNDISSEGLSFKSLSRVDTGTIIDIKLPLARPIFEVKGRVIWCREDIGYFNVGVKFMLLDSDRKQKMIKQICDIDKYKKDVYTKEGRFLTGEEAAAEWIKKHLDKPEGGDVFD